MRFGCYGSGGAKTISSFLDALNYGSVPYHVEMGSNWGAVVGRFGYCEWLITITRWQNRPLGAALSDSGASEM